jgi:hypothetical protein
LAADQAKVTQEQSQACEQYTVHAAAVRDPEVPGSIPGATRFPDK